MAERRYVIAEYPPCRCGNEDCPTYDLVHVLDLPDAEHIHVTRHADGTITAVDADEHLRQSIAAHPYLGSLDVWQATYDTLPVQMRAIVMHVQGQHDDPYGCYEHCALCLAVRGAPEQGDDR